MFNRKVIICAAAAAALLPCISNADSEKASVKACANAFAASLTSSGASVPAVKLDYRTGASTSLAAFYTNEYTFTLLARDPKTGSPLARAMCSIDSHGAVTGMSAMPLDVKSDSLVTSF